jgi:hypothetical protein
MSEALASNEVLSDEAPASCQPVRPEPMRPCFVETLEYRRFAEFCDACRQYRYIGLCYGPPGVGKTLSARRYAHWEALQDLDVYRMSKDQLFALASCGQPDTILYTPPVANTPRSVTEDVSRARTLLHRIAREPIHREEDAIREQRRRQYEEERDLFIARGGWWDPASSPDGPPQPPPLAELAAEFSQREKAVRDPTSLLLVDEAERLKMVSLEAMRDIFDRGGIGLVLIGMPGIEKRLARYPQLYSRVGFVHEFRPLSVGEVRRLLDESWAPAGVNLPSLDTEAVAAIIRITGGNFRLLHRLLAQAERVARINSLSTVTRQVIEAARESLVIGQL